MMRRRRHRAVTAALMLTACAAGCTDCRESRQVWTATVGSPLYDTVLGFVADAIADGYRCPSTAVRNANGDVVAYDYVCTKCD